MKSDRTVESATTHFGFAFRATLIAAIVAVLAAAAPAKAERTAVGITCDHLRCEYLVDPLGIDEPAPRLSWTLSAEGRGVSQSAYQIAVASTEQMLEHPDLWDTGKVESSETIQIEYQGKPLTSRQACFWRVRAWDQSGEPGPWSQAAHWEMGLLEPSDWEAKWIDGRSRQSAGPLKILKATYQTIDGKIAKDVTAAVKSKVHDNALDISVSNDDLGGDPADHKKKQLKLRYTLGTASPVDTTYEENVPVSIPPRPISALRRDFHVDGSITKARLYVTALGIYDVRLNGDRVGNHVLAPDWTDYKKRIRYQVYDVTNQLKTGDNAITGMVAGGWYAGHIGNGRFRYWGDRPMLLAQLEITHDDGKVDRICTGSEWKSHASPILNTDFMLGEDYDARMELPSSSDLTEKDGWTPVNVDDPKTPALQSQVSVPVTELMTLTPKSLNEPAPGHWVFDLGQNMVGVARIKVSAPAGTKITIRFAEMLEPDKTIYTANYRGAPSIDTYICKGGGIEVWQPRFTFHGFRYVQLTGLPAKPGMDAVTGVVLGSVTPQVGQFTCSDPRINQLQSNIQWGQRGNFLSVPTDCPQRDERLGWMGDAQVFIGTAVYNADVSAFFTKWLVDVDDAQTADGQFSNVSPDNGAGTGTPAWGDAGVICPWTIFHAYGDRRELKRHLPDMIKWVEWDKAHTVGLIRKKDLGSHFGDWLSINAKTPDDLLATAYFAHSTDLVARSAKAVGDEEDAKKYGELFDQIKTAFVDKYVDKEGSMTANTETDYAMALQFGLLPDDLRHKAADRLAEDVKAKGDHLSTGFVGVSYLLPALANNGHPDTAFRLLMQDTFPSWLFSVSHGATTIWERWDGWTPEKGFQDAGMNSFNHYSLGSCGQWMYEGIAGISQPPDGDSFKQIVIRPHVGGGLTSASAKYDSIRGLIVSDWKVTDGRIVLTVTIPPNTTATVHVPTAAPLGVTEAGKPVSGDASIKVLKPESDSAIFEIGSGTYVFDAAAPKSPAN
jgi:alpha-L-rhamnosidase